MAELNKMQRFGMALGGRGAALMQFDQEEERRGERKDNKAAEIALKMLETAPQGSKARALAISTLNNLGFQSELVEGLQAKAPAPQLEKVSPGSSLVSVGPEGKTATEVFRAPAKPQQPQTTGEERIINTIAKLRIKKRNEGLTELETEMLDLFEEANNRRTDPMRMLQQQLLGGFAPGGGGRQAELTPRQTDAVERAKRALNAGRPRDAVVQRLQDAYDMTPEQIRAAGF